MNPTKERVHEPPEATRLQPLAEKIQRHTALVAVLGLGYVGLPLVEHLLKAGFPVLGLDVDREKLDRVRNGNVADYEVSTDLFQQAHEREQLQLTTDATRLRDVDVAIICVPTPLSKYRDPDLSHVIEASRMLARVLHEQMLVILESTSYPGTTREVVYGNLSRQGYQIGQDYAVAYSPERIDPGNPQYTLKNTPKVVGGMTPVCRWLAALFYRQFVDHVVEVSSPEVAEMTKLLENIFRAINIGLVNELAVIAEKIGIDVWEVIEAAGTKPFGFMKFYPGPGLGGHCIPIDPLYLSWRVRTLNTMARFIDLADEINRNMPQHVAHRIMLALNEHRKPIKGARICLLGITYKKDVADLRESPATDIAKWLSRWGAQLIFHDPYVKDWELDGMRIPRLAIEDPRDLAWSRLQEFDLVVVVTDHDWYDYERLLEHSPVIFDCRNAFHRRGLRGRRPGQLFRVGTPLGVMTRGAV